MSPLLELITPLKVLLSYAVPFAIWGIVLLRQYLSNKPVTRRQIEHAAWIAFIAGCWILFGNAGVDAYQRAMISLTTAVISQAALFVLVAGSFHLVERGYPDESKA